MPTSNEILKNKQKKKPNDLKPYTGNERIRPNKIVIYCGT